MSSHEKNSNGFKLWAVIAAGFAFLCAWGGGAEAAKDQVEKHMKSELDKAKWENHHPNSKTLDELEYYKQEAAYSREMFERNLRWIENN